MMNTFWNGKNEEQVNKLNKLIPITGKIEGENKKALENWRKLQNMYYEIYNNGGCNWSVKLMSEDLRTLSRFAKVKLLKKDICPSHRSDDSKYVNLEKLADIVFAAACKEQNIS